MATSHKVTDKFLTCTVCMEFFTDPVSLDCQHTFCSKCLIAFAKTQPEAIKTKSLPCPVCRKLTKVSDGNKPLEEWTREMKPSFVIQGLIDSCGREQKIQTSAVTVNKKGRQHQPQFGVLIVMMRCVSDVRECTNVS